MKFPQPRFVILCHCSRCHFNGSMEAIVVALRDGIQDVGPSMCLMSRHVATDLRFDGLDGSLGIRTLLFVLNDEMFDAFLFQ